MDKRLIQLSIISSLGALALTFQGCASDVSCGDGTELVDGQCVAVGPGTPLAGGAPGAGNPSTTPTPGTETPGTETPGTETPGTETPGTETPGIPNGCDGAECDEWGTQVMALFGAAAQAAGCATPLAEDAQISALAQTSADANAAAISFVSQAGYSTQITAINAQYQYVAGMYSATREGPEDVLARWQADAQSNAIIADCYLFGGVGVATAESGMTYVTIYLARPL